MLAIDGDVPNVLVLKAVVGGSEGAATVVADLHAFALGANDEFLRVLRVNDQRVDDPGDRGHALEVFIIDGLPQAAGCTGIENVGIRGIHADQLRAPKNVGNALIFDPLRAAVGAVVDAGT